MAGVDQDYQARSRFGLRKKAVRPALPARMLLMAPSGAGKTWTSLSIATELKSSAGAIVLIDTEQDQGEHTSSLTYADIFDFDYVPWENNKGFDVRDLTATLRDAHKELGPGDVLIIDGISPFWKGVGGILDMVDSKFGSWSKVRPFQEDMMRELKSLECHVILTVRSNQKFAVQEYEDRHGNTRQKVENIGVGVQFDANIIYDMNVTVSLEKDTHVLTVEKSRTTELADRSWAAEQERDFAAIYRDWLAAGKELISKEQQTALIARFAIIDEDHIGIAKREFLSECGRPQDVLVDDLPRAEAMACDIIDRFVAEGFGLEPEPEPEGPKPEPEDKPTDVVPAPVHTPGVGSQPPVDDSKKPEPWTEEQLAQAAVAEVAAAGNEENDPDVLDLDEGEPDDVS